MSLETWLLYLAAGRLLTWLLQTNGLMRPVWGLSSLLTELRDCDLCLGFWVYLTLAILSPHTQFLSLLNWPAWLGVIVLAALSAFIAHLLRLGYQSKFGITVID